MYKKFIKRLIDVAVSFVAIIILLPVFVVVTTLLAISYKGNPFFLQKRPGRYEQIFQIIKFKTMNDNTDKNGILLPDSKRITTLGKLVRSTSLDEIPQLINVLKGDMSLVGPRPLRTYYLPLYSDVQKRRHDVRPGITGWAQINGRNTISWSKKFEYDVWYVRNLSFYLDCKIMVLTALKVIRRKDVNSSEIITMEPFNGSN